VKNLIIAKRYAKALFNLAREEGKVEAYGEELAGLVQLFDANPELAGVIQSPLYPEAARKAIFTSIVTSANLTPIMKSLVNLLIEKNRVTNLGEIKDYYMGLIDEHANVARAKITAAVGLDEKVIGQVAASLEKLTGKKIAVDFQQDPALIGGLVARIGDLVLDGSVRTQLFNIRETLKRGELG
jgi:F-type H+-transporting ATPase subunit delta